MKINTTIQTPKQIDITATTGTAPLKIASTTAIPNLNVDMVDGKHATDFAAASHTHTKSQISDLSLSTVATSGSYNDLLNKPVIPAAYTHPAYTTRTVSLDASGAEVIDTISLTSDASGHITAASASKRTLTLANLGYTGATNANYYTHPSGDGNLHVPATGTANNGKILKAGATAGSLSWGNLTYSDVGAAALSHTHTKSQITDWPTFAAVATSGSYNDLLNKPTIPTKTSQLTNDSGYITGGAFLSTSGGTLTGNLTLSGSTAKTILYPGAVDLSVYDSNLPGWRTSNIYLDSAGDLTIDSPGVHTNYLTVGSALVNDDLTVSGNMKISGLLDVSYYTQNTGSVYANQWTKIASLKVTSQYADSYAYAILTNRSDGGGSSDSAIMSARLKQQSAMGSAPSIEVHFTNARGLFDVIGVVTANTASLTQLDIYVKIIQSYMVVNIYPLAYYGQVSFFNNQGFSTALPAGTQIAPDRNLYANGAAVSVDGHTHTNGSGIGGPYSLSSHNHDGSYVNISGDTMSGNLTVPRIITSNWLYSTGATGWYNDTYGGGWYMSDSSWIRAYGSKSVYTPNKMQADAGFFVGSNEVWHQGNVTEATSASTDSGIEGYIKFPNGIIIQWGGVEITPTSGVNTFKTVTFKTPFTVKPRVITTNWTSYSDIGSSATNITTTNFSGVVKRSDAGVLTLMWIAIGY